MNKKCETIFKKIADILKSYCEQADALGNSFNANKAYYQQTFRDPDAYITADRERIADALNTLIASTRSQLASCKEMLNNELSEWTMQAPDEAFISQMETYNKFGLTMTEGEINTFLQQTKGNVTAMRILKKIAANSGFELSFDEVSDFQKDLRDLDGISNALDVSLPISCRDFLPKMRQASTGVWYSLDSVGAIMAQTVLNSYLRDLDSVSDKWSVDCQPTIKVCLESLKQAENEKSVDFSFQRTPADAELTAENPFESDGIFTDADTAKLDAAAAKYFH